MTSLSNADRSSPLSATSPKAAPVSTSLFNSTRVVIILGMALALGVGWRQLLGVWQSQTFGDTDDAMHLVQVRDWLAGQAWFDLTAYRLDPPGTLMHWSRVIDVPLALLIRLFELVTTQEWAERWTRIVYPMLLQFALFSTIVALAGKLAGRRGVAPAIILTAFSIAVGVQFSPGRLAHHNVQIVLLMLMVWANLDVLDPRRARRGALAGFLAALSLSINIENLPFVLTMIAILGIAWIWRGRAMAAGLAWFGSGLAASALLAFVLTIPPWRYFANVCDAFAAAHLIGTVVGGAGLVGLGLATSRLADPLWRALAGAAAGSLTIVAVGLAYPDCFKDPFSAVDPLVHKIWLENVTQTQPMATMLRLETLATLPQAMPLFLGLIAACLAAWRETGPSRGRWLAVATFVAIGVIGACWEVRVASSTAPIAALAGAWVFAQSFELTAEWRRAWRLLPFALTLPFVPFAWAAAFPAPDVPARPQAGDPRACFASSAFTALKSLPTSLLMAPIDPAPYVLAFTQHSVIAGPYHRDNHGNRLALDVFLGAPEKVRGLLEASGARYLIACPAADELALFGARAPGSLADLLSKGEAPAWLHPVAVPGTPYRVYEIGRTPPAIP